MINVEYLLHMQCYNYKVANLEHLIVPDVTILRLRIDKGYQVPQRIQGHESTIMVL